MNIKKPNRKKYGYAQHLNAPPETVFPLLCPVLEVEWVPDWLPEMVISQSGVCEQDCIFITPPEIPSKPESSIWLVTKYDSDNLALEMYKVAPGHSISKLEISLIGGSDNTTTAHISYEITALAATGDKFIEAFNEEWYEGFMVEWEKQMNYYLETGKKIR